MSLHLLLPPLPLSGPPAAGTHSTLCLFIPITYSFCTGPKPKIDNSFSLFAQTVKRRREREAAGKL